MKLTDSPSPDTLRKYRNTIEQELFERVLPFWERHSPDHACGGYFNNLDQDGSVYDTTKHIWLLARQAWMFSKLYRMVEPRPEWLILARLGLTFLRTHARRPNGQVYFSLAQDGRPIYQQRKIYSECFYAMALAEFGRASDNAVLVEEARETFTWLWENSYDWSTVGRPALSGSAPSQSLAIPMMLLNVLDEVMEDELQHFRPEIDDCFNRIKLHVDHQDKIVLENVTPDGERLEGPNGRLMNPGHAIEAGWFIHHLAQRMERNDMSDLATKMIQWSWKRGWDTSHGGIFYFLDCEGYSPVQLEWSMKLWWPHCEALYANLLNFSIAGSPTDWENFETVFQYSFENFSDPEYGEWFGYLDREGRCTHRFKGGPYKGCFHVPRALWLCWCLLNKMLATAEHSDSKKFQPLHA